MYTELIIGSPSDVGKKFGLLILEIEGEKMLFLWRVVVILVALKSLILEFVCLFLSFF
jgi:hypothetical protein